MRCLQARGLGTKGAIRPTSMSNGSTAAGCRVGFEAQVRVEVPRAPLRKNAHNRNNASAGTSLDSNKHDVASRVGERPSRW